MTGSDKLAVYIFLQLSDTPRGLNEGEGNECIRLSWMDFRELQFINARRDKYARILRFGLPRTGVRGSGANLNVSFVFKEYRPLAPLVRLSDAVSFTATDDSFISRKELENAWKLEGSGLMCNFAA